MNVKAGVNFHNRFDIEVRDSKTGELKQKGQAENIVLDRMYERLCNFDSYFDYIHFGQGTGTLDPSRNALFNKLGYKSAATEETIKASPVSKWTRKITLSPEEYVGKSITEVGISDSESYINTHALIKDAEGNPLSIEKTDTDVVVIYATIFIELEDKNENIKWTGFPNNNALINSLTNTKLEGFYVNVNEIKEPLSNQDWLNTHPTNSYFGNTKRVYFTSDIPNRKTATVYRYGIDQANFDIRTINFSRKYENYRTDDLFTISLPDIGVYEGYDIVDEILDVGDDTSTVFNFKHEDIVEPIKVYIDGAITNNYSLNKGTPYGKNILRGCVPVVVENITISGKANKYWFGISYRDRFAITVGEGGGHFIFDLGENNSNTSYNKITVAPYISDFYLKMSCCDTLDGIYTVILSKTHISSSGNFNADIVPTVGRYIKMEFDEGSTYIEYFKLYSSTHNVTFNEPIGIDSIVTADYRTTVIPKTADYVLDVSAEIQFGEGAM